MLWHWWRNNLNDYVLSDTASKLHVQYATWSYRNLEQKRREKKNAKRGTMAHWKVSYQEVWQLFIIVFIFSLTWPWKQTDWPNQPASRRHISHIDYRLQRQFTVIFLASLRVHNTCLKHKRSLLSLVLSLYEQISRAQICPFSDHFNVMVDWWPMEILTYGVDVYII